MKWLATEDTPLIDALRALGEDVVLEARPEPEADDDPRDFPIGRHLAAHGPSVLLAVSYDRPPGLDKGAVLMWRRGAPGRRVIGIAHGDPEGYQRQLRGQRRQCALPSHGLDLYCTVDEVSANLVRGDGRRALVLGTSADAAARVLSAVARAIGALE